MKIHLLVVDDRTQKVTYFDGSLHDFSNYIDSILNTENQTNISNKFQVGSLTLCLLIANIIMFLVSALISKSMLSIDNSVLIRLGANYKPLILHGEIYRFITCTFLHEGILHIAMNMYAIYFLGTIGEKFYKPINFVLIYFVTGFFASFSSYLTASTNTISIGASGAIMGLLGAVFAYSLIHKSVINKDFTKNLMIMIALNIFIGLAIPNIDNSAHVGGLLSGFLLGYAITYLDSRK